MTKEIKKTKTASVGAPSITPLGDRVLIKENVHAKENKTASGIIIPVTVHEDKGSKRGKVIAVGAGRYDDGELVPMSIKVGNEVVFQWGEKVTIDGEEYYIVREGELLAIVG